MPDFVQQTQKIVQNFHLGLLFRQKVKVMGGSRSCPNHFAAFYTARKGENTNKNGLDLQTPVILSFLRNPNQSYTRIRIEQDGLRRKLEFESSKDLANL